VSEDIFRDLFPHLANGKSSQPFNANTY
jgi:hypothetical protein